MNQPGATTPVRGATSKGGNPSEEQFVRAFNEVRTELVSTLAFFLGNYEDGLDAAQEAFLKCWRNREGLPDVVNLRAWIFRVGLNSAKDLQRNAYRRRARPLTGAAALVQANGQLPHDDLQEQEDQERLRDAILKLRPEEQEVFLLRQNGSLTFEEIADLRQSPVGTVKTQMRSAIAKLRQALQEK